MLHNPGKHWWHHLFSGSCILSGACPHAELPAEPSPVLVSAFHLSRLQQAALCLPSWKQNLIQGHMSACHPSFPFRARSEEHTSELQSLMSISYAVFCLKKK